MGSGLKGSMLVDTIKNTLLQVKKASNTIKLDKTALKMITSYQRIFEVSIPVRMDDGKIELFTGYRLQHNNARDPYKKGIRFDPNVNLE